MYFKCTVRCNKEDTVNEEFLMTKADFDELHVSPEAEKRL